MVPLTQDSSPQHTPTSGKAKRFLARREREIDAEGHRPQQDEEHEKGRWPLATEEAACLGLSLMHVAGRNKRGPSSERTGWTPEEFTRAKMKPAR
jgi:hypothetical protein